MLELLNDKTIESVGDFVSYQVYWLCLHWEQFRG